jgi:hypothetical protein
VSSGEDNRLIEADHQGIDTAMASCELTFNAVVDGEGVFRLADIQNSGLIVRWSIRRARITTNVPQRRSPKRSVVVQSDHRVDSRGA